MSDWRTGWYIVKDNTEGSEKEVMAGPFESQVSAEANSPPKDCYSAIYIDKNNQDSFNWESF